MISNKKQLEKVKKYIYSVKKIIQSNKSETVKVKQLHKIFLNVCEDILSDLQKFGAITDNKTKKMFELTLELAQYSIERIKELNALVKPSSKIYQVLSSDDQLVSSWLLNHMFENEK